MKKQVTIRVPASTSNLGPGFDCLGVALNLHNSITLRADAAGPLPPIAAAAARRFFTAVGIRPFPFALDIDGEIPIARGVGSSAAIRLGVLHSLNALCDLPLSCGELFVLCAGLEGHPDNAAAATFGGFTVARKLNVQRFDVSEQLRFVLLVPDLEIETEKARRVLPEMIARTDAVMSAGNAAAIVAAFAAAAYENLRGLFQDRLHQPYREQLMPFLPAVITAAENAGALGAFLSGSGSSICAVTLNSAPEIGRAMKQASGLRQPRMLITTANNRGVGVAEADALNVIT